MFNICIIKTWFYIYTAGPVGGARYFFFIEMLSFVYPTTSRPHICLDIYCSSSNVVSSGSPSYAFAMHRQKIFPVRYLDSHNNAAGVCYCLHTWRCVRLLDLTVHMDRLCLTDKPVIIDGFKVTNTASIKPLIVENVPLNARYIPSIAYINPQFSQKTALSGISTSRAKNCFSSSQCQTFSSIASA